MTWAIRPALPADIPAISELEQTAFTSDRFSPRQFRYLLTRARATALVAVGGGHLLGYAVSLYRTGTRRARLYGIAVAETARGQGVASALIAALARDARARQCTRLGLEVRADNDAAQGLYSKLGFRVERRVADYYEDGAAAVRMALPLTD